MSQLENDAVFLGSSGTSAHFHHSASQTVFYNYHPQRSIKNSKNTAAPIVLMWKQSPIGVLSPREEPCVLLHALPSKSSFPPLSPRILSPSAGFLFYFFPSCSQVPGREGSEKHESAGGWQSSAFLLIIGNEERPGHWAVFHTSISCNKLA